MKLTALICGLALGTPGLTLPVNLTAATIFDNSKNDLLTRFNPGTAEVGDELMLAGSERFLTNFSFEYWGTNTAGASAFAGAIEARVRFYRNDGAEFNGYASPGSLLYDSQWFFLGEPTERNTQLFEAGRDFPQEGLFLPVSELTWSVQFRGMGSTDLVGVDLYSPPTTGTAFPDYWEFEGAGWQLMTNSVPMDFASRFEASLTSVPEPSAVALMTLVAVGCAGRRIRLGKRQRN